jgi:hypothetical protein
MTYEIAKEIVASALAFFEPTNAIIRCIDQIEDESVRKELMTHAEMVTQHSTALILKVSRRHPDLNPFK